MSHDAVTLVFYIDGREGAEKALEVHSAAVPRVGELVQLGPYGGPYDWRRVTEVTWRHEPTLRGGVSAAILLDFEPVGHASRASGPAAAGDGGRAVPSKPRKKDDDRQQKLLDT